MKKKYIPSALIWTVTAMALSVWIVYTAISIPIVTLSRSAWLEADYITDQHATTDELSATSCVKVEPPAAGDCGRLPKRYSIVWSQ